MIIIRNIDNNNRRIKKNNDNNIAKMDNKVKAYIAKETEIQSKKSVNL